MSPLYSKSVNHASHFLGGLLTALLLLRCHVGERCLLVAESVEDVGGLRLLHDSIQSVLVIRNPPARAIHHSCARRATYLRRVSYLQLPSMTLITFYCGALHTLALVDYTPSCSETLRNSL